MKIYKVCENYGGEVFHIATFEDFEKAVKYCNILNESKDINGFYFVKKEILEFDDE